MAHLPPASDIPLPELPLRRAGNQSRDSSDDHPPEWLRNVRRVMRDVEEVREHCRRQMKMIAEQRELLRGLDATHGPSFDGAAAGATWQREMQENDAGK